MARKLRCRELLDMLQVCLFYAPMWQQLICNNMQHHFMLKITSSVAKLDSSELPLIVCCPWSSVKAQTPTNLFLIFMNLNASSGEVCQYNEQKVHKLAAWCET